MCIVSSRQSMREDDGHEAVNAARCVARSSQDDHAVPWYFSAAGGAKGVDFSSFFWRTQLKAYLLQGASLSGLFSTPHVYFHC